MRRIPQMTATNNIFPRFATFVTFVEAAWRAHGESINCLTNNPISKGYFHVISLILPSFSYFQNTIHPPLHVPCFIMLRYVSEQLLIRTCKIVLLAYPSAREEPIDRLINGDICRVIFTRIRSMDERREGIDEAPT